MAGACVEKLPHSCGSRNGLQVFAKEDGTYDGYCFSCKRYVPNPYEDKPEGYAPKAVRRTKEEIEAELADIKECEARDLPDRRLRKETLEAYGVKIGVDEKDGVTPKFHYYPYSGGNAYKVRLIENKRMWSVGDMHDTHFFGWDKARATGGKKLFITEGECDAMALYQIILDYNKGTKYEGYEPAVVSLPHGSSSAAKSIAKHIEDIKKTFQEIILVFDMDEPGRKASEDVLRILPDAKVASLPEKDANACLVEGRSKACYSAVVFNAKTPKNTRLVWGHSLVEAGRKQAEWGVTWPWEGLTELTRGIRLGETIYIGAGVKMGKSEVVNALSAHCIIAHGWKVFLAKPEEANRKSFQMLAGKVVGRIFHDPKIPFDFAAYDEAAELLRDKVCMVNLYQHMGWETLKADIREAAMEGCKAIFIDPITNLTNGMNAADANVKLQEIAQELSAMALDLNIVIFIFCHLKAPEGGASHERGGEVMSHQFAGSRAMMRSCNMMIGIEGNKDPELPKEQRNLRHLVLLEDREFGNSGKIHLYWDDRTSFFNELN